MTERTAANRVVSILQIITALCVIVFSALKIFNVWENADYVYMPLMCIMLFLQALNLRTHNRGVAVFLICAAVFILLTFVVMILVEHI